MKDGNGTGYIIGFIIVLVCFVFVIRGFTLNKWKEVAGEVGSQIEQSVQEREQLRDTAKEMAKEGAVVYLHGVEVDIDTIHLEAYEIEIKEDKVILWD